MLILQMLLSTMASNQIQPKRRYSWLTATLLLALWSVNVPNAPCWASCRVVSTRPGQESTPGRTMKPCTNNLLLILLLSGANLLRNFTGSRRYSNQSSVLVQINRQNQGLSNSVGNIQTATVLLSTTMHMCHHHCAVLQLVNSTDLQRKMHHSFGTQTGTGSTLVLMAPTVQTSISSNSQSNAAVDMQPSGPWSNQHVQHEADSQPCIPLQIQSHTSPMSPCRSCI